MLLETAIQSMFVGFCSYLGARLAHKTHKIIKRKK
jgi:hypothetical protein